MYLKRLLIYFRKTQIALAYAYWVQQNFLEMSIFWIHASNPERFHQALFQIAQSCQIPGHDDPKADISSLVKAWLERKNQCPWLMIIDNADDSEIFFDPGTVRSNEPGGINQPLLKANLGRYIPECPQGSILITTRNKQAGVKLTKGRCVIEVGEMTPAESSQLIHERLDDNGLHPDHVAFLTARLENLPLALVQAAAFIHENSLTVETYLELLEKSDNTLTELLSQPFQEVGRDSSVPNAVAATWIVSFKQIRDQYPLASDLLSLTSFFDRQGIPKLFLSFYKEQRHNQEDRQQEDQVKGDLEFEKALGILKAFSFVSEGKADGNLNMHRLIQLVMRKWLIMEGISTEWASRALLTVSDLYPYGSYKNWKVCGVYLPHVYAVLSYDRSVSTDEAVAKASLLHCTAGFMLNQGKWNKAEELQLQAVETLKRVLGQEHPDTLTSIANLASTYRNQGRWKEAEELEVQVMETRKRVLGQEHPHTLNSMSNLAFTWKFQDRNREAVNLMVECVQLRKKKLGVDHPHTKSSLEALNEWQAEGCTGG
jgi:hypothetical protein